MPIEIRELVIRAVVDQSVQNEGGTDRSAGDSDSADHSLEETVQQVLELLRENRNER
jgi:hypothetical protein